MTAKKRDLYLEISEGILALRDARADDDWDEDEDEPLDQTDAHHEAPESPMAHLDLLLDLLQATSRLQVLLTECDPAEFKAAKGRLTAFRTAVQALPAKASPKEPIGFKAPAKKTGRKTKKGGRS